jgi:hypothetical protein
MKLLTNAASNAKTAKGIDGFGLEAVIMHLAPHTVADGKRNVCPWASKGCAAACLNTSGRAQISGDLSVENLSQSMIHRARRERTLAFLDDRETFIHQLKRELTNLVKRADKKGRQPVARLNGTSDIAWERFGVHTHTGVTFYDYTKSKARALAQPYHLTFSRSEDTPDADVHELIDAGVNVAVVFAGDRLPETFLRAPVLDGLEHDFRFKDPKGHIVGLLAKARAKRDETGFVVSIDDERCG